MARLKRARIILTAFILCLNIESRLSVSLGYLSYNQPLITFEDKKKYYSIVKQAKSAYSKQGCKPYLEFLRHFVTYKAQDGPGYNTIKHICPNIRFFEPDKVRIRDEKETHETDSDS